MKTIDLPTVLGVGRVTGGCLSHGVLSGSTQAAAGSCGRPETASATRLPFRGPLRSPFPIPKAPVSHGGCLQGLSLHVISPAGQGLLFVAAGGSRRVKRNHSARKPPSGHEGTSLLLLLSVKAGQRAIPDSERAVDSTLGWEERVTFQRHEARPGFWWPSLEITFRRIQNPCTWYNAKHPRVVASALLMSSAFPKAACIPARGTGLKGTPPLQLFNELGVPWGPSAELDKKAQ